jgi:hypothetical protein
MDNRKKRIEQLKKLVRAFSDPCFSDPCESTIYHYTSAAGLRGIIENHEIWLTNTAFVNDTTECKALRNEECLFAEDEFTHSFAVEQWRNFRSNPDKANNTYIASFSRGEESLQQWHAYGNFRIGFEAKKLTKHSFNLYECVYYRQEIKSWILEKEKVQEWEGDCLNDSTKRAAAFALFHAARMKYKSQYYENEKEVRLIAISNHSWTVWFDNESDYHCSMFKYDPPIHFRDHPVYRVPIPYVKLILSNEEDEGYREEKEETAIQMKERKLKEERDRKRLLLPITEVRIGPMLHQEEAEVACEILLGEKGYRDVEVNTSKIPYRGF